MPGFGLKEALRGLRQLVELGTPKELMARSGGRFRSLVNAEHS